MTLSLPVRYLIRFVALAYVSVLLVVPVGLILWRTFTPGFGQFVGGVRRRGGFRVLWGSAGLLGFVERDFGFKIIFGLPGIVLASVFATLPFVVREVEPVLHEVGTDQEQAAATLGSSWWQTFWRITLPSIRWGLTYGIVLTVARTLGEYGAVIMVSSNLPGQSQTLTLLVSDRYNRGAEYGAYAISTLLMVVSVFVLIVQVILDARLKRATKQA